MSDRLGSYPADVGLSANTPGSALPGFSKVRNGRRYELVVVQQPSRARMCGFGDKDRRPLSPTLIVKLLVYDAESGRELHPSEVNTSLFFVTSDLCHPDDLMIGPRNILVHHHGAPPPVPSGKTSSSIPAPSPSIDGSVMSGVQDTLPTSPGMPQHDPSASGASMFGADVGPHSYPPLPGHPLQGMQDAQLWTQPPSSVGNTASSSFLPASSYGTSDAPESSSRAHGFGPTSQGAGFDPNLGLMQASAAPIASGLAGSYSMGEPPSTPSTGGLPATAAFSGAPASSSMGAYDYQGSGMVGALSSQMGPQAMGTQASQPHQQGSVVAAASASSTSIPTPLYHPTSVFPSSAPLTSLTSTHPLTSENLTRNLVGSAVASANVLRDLDDRVCIFFVLQDISVRTEGVYRIKLMFADLGLNGTLNRGISEALAETYTDTFVVYSPRRFPGMHDPTELSRKLVAQGVKIPVRSDRKKHGRTEEAEARGGVGASKDTPPGQPSSHPSRAEQADEGWTSNA